MPAIKKKKKVKTTEDVLELLCFSVKKVLCIATKSEISFSPIIQRVSKTCLKPDIGCFVMFDGGFSGLVVMNFSAAAAIEIYRNYMINMGMPEEEISPLYTSDDVSNSLGELMNQIIGDFQVSLKNNFHVTVCQNQPKMLVINKELMISVNAQIDRPQFRKVTFETENHRPFYLEISMEKTEFVELFSTDDDESESGNAVVNANAGDKTGADEKNAIGNSAAEAADDDFLKQFGF